ncbi:MAG: DUF5056 domain-containing protein [Bacteroidales bacterium]|jgi:hypothetical protein|nr:DUF5056 domain-containing protein [Bacteroidales bacterium]MDD2203952.1 DUF5056 domain-containing protein [Bacteroidales bacterium]MDD3152110.1 DUF5056 domain-containing protein [Bacteroidales bacterium]MDD3913459.1 DUF5056 domain-containing protein [Bacteroidales bacterium]MDD4633255.1 DUF5056 domain-containing protein [Bacteroidales bacterium]
MEETDKMLFDFMHENRHEIKDKGFSQKVANAAISQKAKKFSIFWNTLCIVGCLAFLTILLFDKYSLIKTTFNQIWNAIFLDLQPASFSGNILSTYFMFAFLIGIWTMIIIGVRHALQK